MKNPTAPACSKSGKGKSAPVSLVFERNGPPVLIWTRDQERAYRAGKGPPPFER